MGTVTLSAWSYDPSCYKRNEKSSLRAKYEPHLPYDQTFTASETLH